MNSVEEQRLAKAQVPRQLSVSFGVAAASLVAALFVPDRFHTDAPQMVRGIHEAFLVLGVAAIVSTIVFRGLRGDDGSQVSQHKAVMPVA